MIDKDSAEITTIVARAKYLLDYASADCSECGCPGASFGHGSAVEVERIVEQLAKAIRALKNVPPPEGDGGHRRSDGGE